MPNITSSNNHCPPVALFMKAIAAKLWHWMSLKMAIVWNIKIVLNLLGWVLLAATYLVFRIDVRDLGGSCRVARHCWRYIRLSLLTIVVVVVLILMAWKFFFAVVVWLSYWLSGWALRSVVIADFGFRWVEIYGIFLFLMHQHLLWGQLHRWVFKSNLLNWIR